MADFKDPCAALRDHILMVGVDIPSDSTWFRREVLRATRNTECTAALLDAIDALNSIYATLPVHALLDDAQCTLLATKSLLQDALEILAQQMRTLH